MSATSPPPTEPPLTAVVVVILTVVDDDLRVLLIHRAGDPYRGSWALPGGLLAEGESLDRAAARKLHDETGVRDVYLEQLYTFGELPRGDDARRGVAVTYFALVQYGQVRLAERTEWAPEWHSVYKLPALAFDNNAVVDYALRRLRSKLEYTNVAYSLLPRQFTLSDLQQVYEAILDRELDKRNFRRRMLSLGVIKPAGGRRMEGAHRPAQLYAFTKREPVLV
ncbi:MAG: NUDIX hydrolase [Chloroflexota bacterium]|nr:NUDIX hydrolase [Chloroflexota bacterium]